MGVFDSVYANCRICHRQVEFQSKAAMQPSLRNLRSDAVPPEIAEDLNGAVVGCKCGNVVKLSIPGQTPFVKMKVS